MKKNILYISVLLAGLIGCKKSKELPGPETPVIQVNQLDDNTFVFTNATPTGGAASLWDFGGIATSRQYSDTIFFGTADTYTVSLTSNSKGGIATSSTTVTVTKSSPYAADFKLTPLNDHTFDLEVITPNALSQKFEYSTGETTTAGRDTVYFPFKGTPVITLTVQVLKDGLPITAIYKKRVPIPQDDMSNPALSDNVFNILTGGLSDVDGRTWVVANAGKIQGVGPYKKDAMDFSYYNYPTGYAGDAAWASGALDNEWTFIMRDYQYIPKNGNATVNYLWIREKFGVPTQAKYSDAARNDADQKPAPFILKNDGTGITGYSLKFGSGSYMAYYDNRYNYEISKISQDSVWIRHSYNDEDTDPNHNDPAFDANQRVILFVPKK